MTGSDGAAVQFEKSMMLSRFLIGLASLVAVAGCNASEEEPDASPGGAGATSGGSAGRGGSTAASGGSNAFAGAGGSLGSGGANAGLGGSLSGSSGGGGSPNAGTSGSGNPAGNSAGGVANSGGANGGSNAQGGTSNGGSDAPGGTANTAGNAAGGTTSGAAGQSGAGTSGGGAGSGGTPASGGAAGMGGSSGNSPYPCDGTTAGYDAVMTKSGSTWRVVNGSERYSGTDMQAALVAAYNSLSSGRTTKQSILVQGDGDIPASAQVAIPSYTILNVCGTLNVSGTPSGSDRSPLYARGKTNIEIPNLTLTGSPQYGIFLREFDGVHLGHIELRLTSSAGIGIRADSGGSASTMTTFSKNLSIDYVYGTGMGSHIVETYGVDGIDIGTVEGEDVGECGLLLNRSINAEIGLVTCTDCATGTGYAAFRVANDVGKIGNSYPAGNIHVGKVVARGGGRGIFSVSGCGGLTIDEIDIAGTGNTSILLQNTYDTTIAAVSGTVSGGLVQISNDTDNTESGRYLPSENVAIKNLVLSGGASVRQDWCSEFGANGCTATNVTGGNVSMCD
ncbi:MAG TPA: hypothetical protein VGK73_09710 [Polyangiaceae bacterium]